MFTVNVLFANDDVLTQWIMTEVLADAGFSVASACRVQQVIELLDDAPDFDVLLMDLKLPDCAACMDVGHHWRSALPGRPIIYTGTDTAALGRSLRFGESFLRTPFGAGALLRTIDCALEEVRYRPLAPALTHVRHQFH